MRDPLTGLDDCGCCEGLGPETPVATANAPGQPAVRYRVGTYGTFLASMRAKLSSSRLPGLLDLTTREADDFTLALVDGWAVVCDVLTFYQERAANEAFLRTATERLSVLELARLIGYELRPGVAASTSLAFTLETTPSSPRRVTVPVGTKVQSVPGPGEKPQVFETTGAVDAHAEWNALRPRLLQDQDPKDDPPKAITVRGTGLRLPPGSVVVVAFQAKVDVLTVLDAVEDTRAATTRLIFNRTAKPQAYHRKPPHAARFLRALRPLSGKVVDRLILGRTWTASDLLAQAAQQRWPLAELIADVQARLADPDPPASPAVLSLHTRASIFGHNAPAWNSLPALFRYSEEAARAGEKKGVAPAYEHNWDDPPRTLADETKALKRTRTIFLDTTYPQIVPGSKVVLTDGTTTRVYTVEDATELTRTGFTLSAKVTALRLDSSDGFEKLKVRRTTVLAESRPLTLAQVPIVEPVRGALLELGGFFPELAAGQRAIVSGERTGLPGAVVSEVVTFDEVRLEGGFTAIDLLHPLMYSYERATVTLNANVAPATHGESVREVLGSGNAGAAYQRFQLRQPPLTYTSAPTPSGGESTLSVYVNSVRWHEVPTLYGREPNERVYITRLADDGVTTVLFGDGRTGARPPTGVENVEAFYRKGIGLDGLVRAGQLSLLAVKPLGVQGVTNPLAADGAADREALAEARENAPLTVLTLDRIVSLQDYEDFARAFAGVGKALATQTWDQRGRGVLVTVAGPGGRTIPTTSALYENLLLGIHAQGDPSVPVSLKPHRPAPFKLSARVKVDPDRIPERVLADVERSLRDAYSFEVRGFGQAVTVSEVEALVQDVPGVVAVDVDALYRTSTPKSLPPFGRLTAALPKADDPTAQGAELLTLDPRALDLGQMP